MAVTSQQIADAAGVSRATVDRALKNRGRVRQEVADGIKKIAAEMGYQPNSAARALALAKNPIKIGIIIQSAETPFMQRVLNGAGEARKEIEREGGKVEIRCIDGVDGEQEIACIKELKAAGMNGIALVPAEDKRIKEEIDNLVENDQIPVVTLNSDVSKSKRLCFVGQDNERAGQVAAGLMAECIERDSKVAVITGTASNPALNGRTRGFKKTLKVLRPDVQIVKIYYIRDDNHESEAVTRKMLMDYPDIKGIFVSAPAVSGICNAVYQCKMENSIKIIANDILDDNLDNLEKGAINFLIGQEAFVQGYEPIMILYRLLVREIKPEKEREYTDIIIRTKYNIYNKSKI